MPARGPPTPADTRFMLIRNATGGRNSGSGGFLHIHFPLIRMNRRIKTVAGHMEKIVPHNIAPADFVFEAFYFRYRSALAAIVLVIIIFTFVLLAPFFPFFHFQWIRKNDLEKGFFLYRLQVVIHVMMVFMPVADDLGCGHVRRDAIEMPDTGCQMPDARCRMQGPLLIRKVD